MMAMVAVMVTMLLRSARCRGGQVQIASDFRGQNRPRMVVVVVASEVTQLVVVVIVVISVLVRFSVLFLVVATVVATVVAMMVTGGRGIGRVAAASVGLRWG